MGVNCVYCKGSHQYTACLLHVRAMNSIKSLKVAKDFQGEAPAPFVGHYGYPSINVGLLSVPDRENTELYDAPRAWGAQRFKIPQIVEFRRTMVNAQAKNHVRSSSRHLERAQEIAMARKPVDVEILLKKKPGVSTTFDHTAAPFGPRAKVEKVRLTSNPTVHSKVDKVLSDTDRKAASAMTYLFKCGFDENFLTRLLSVATLGVKPQRKLVPTRWSITATDDILGKDLLKEVKQCSFANFQIMMGNFMGNYYFFLFFPGSFEYELFELYVPALKKGTLQYSTDYEAFSGRKSYASQCAGGYYTVRLALAEYLKRVKRQAKVLVIRCVTEEYTTPLGVWVTREACRHALRASPLVLDSQELVLSTVRKLVVQKFAVSIEMLLKKSKLVQSLTQRSVTQWI